MLPDDQIDQLLLHPDRLKRRIADALHQQAFQDSAYLRQAIDPVTTSAVLFLLAPGPCGTEGPPEPCLVLNKRSARVRQPGDICCPGGSIAMGKDTWLSRLLNLPFSPLTRWPFWPRWIQARGQEASNLAFLLATGMRESYEEMRLNPLKIQFLGPLPAQRLVMFERTIYPMVCWVPRQKQFTPNWEVDGIVYVALRRLLEPANYARFHLTIDVAGSSNGIEKRVFPCFLLENGDRMERLWGVTFRIAMAFVRTVFGFEEPDADSLPEIRGRLEENYLTGSG